MDMMIIMHSEGKRGCSAEPIHYTGNDVTISGDVLLDSLLMGPVIVTTGWAGCLCYSVFLCVCLAVCLA
jgi:hypothetical protein